MVGICIKEMALWCEFEICALKNGLVVSMAGTCIKEMDLWCEFERFVHWKMGSRFEWHYCNMGSSLVAFFGIS